MELVIEGNREINCYFLTTTGPFLVFDVVDLFDLVKSP